MFEAIALAFRDDWLELFRLAQVCKAIRPYLLNQLGAVGSDKRMLTRWMRRLPTPKEAERVATRPWKKQRPISLWILHNVYHYCLDWQTLWADALCRGCAPLGWIDRYPTPGVLLKCEQFSDRPRYNPDLLQYPHAAIDANLMIGWTLDLGHCPPIECFEKERVVVRFCQLSKRYRLDWNVCGLLIEHLQIDKHELLKNFQQSFHALKHKSALIRWLLPQIEGVSVEHDHWFDPDRLCVRAEFQHCQLVIGHNTFGFDESLIDFLRAQPVEWIVRNIDLSNCRIVDKIDRVQLSAALFNAKQLSDLSLWQHSLEQLVELSKLIDLPSPHRSFESLPWYAHDSRQKMASLTLTLGRFDWWQSPDAQRVLEKTLYYQGGSVIVELARRVLDLDQARERLCEKIKRQDLMGINTDCIILLDVVEQVLPIFSKRGWSFQRQLVSHVKDRRERLRNYVLCDRHLLATPADLIDILDLFTPQELIDMNLNLTPKDWTQVLPYKWKIAFRLYAPSGHWVRTEDALEFVKDHVVC